MTPKVGKFSRMSFRIPRRDTEVRFVTKIGENRPLRSCRKVVWNTTQITRAAAGLVPIPICLKWADRTPKFPERCHPLTCSHTANLVLIVCVLPDLLRNIDFSAQKVNTIGLQPTITM